jgi:nucleotide-binding universal stress UspA family protein
MFKKILVPLDGSALAAAALLPASALARRDDAELILVGAASTSHVAEIDAYLATMVNCLNADGLTAQAMMPLGSPENAVNEEAALACADLIVIATQGRDGMDALHHPNVTWRVLARTSAPVLIIRYADEDQEMPAVHQLAFMTDPTAPILVPLDGTLSAERVLPLVREIGQMFGNPVVLVRAGDPLLLAEGTGALDLAPGGAVGCWMDEADAYLCQKQAELTRDRLKVTHVIELGMPAAVIQAAALDYHAGLIIMASHGQGWLGRLVLGNVTRSVVSQSDIPILLVRRFVPVSAEEARVEQVLTSASVW